MADVTLSFPKSPQVKLSILKFIVAPAVPPPFLQKTGLLATTDAKYAGRSGSFFKRYPIEMQAGVTYTIDLKSAFDTFLFLEDANGKILRRDDDGGTGLNSRIVHRPAETRKYHIVTTTYGPNQTGAFRLYVRKTK